jgi:tRNA A-37 threonylcarbamoyl transferase component Bud32
MGLLFQESFLYTLASADFYESLDRLPINENDFITIARRHLSSDWRCICRGTWCYCTPDGGTIPPQGWKIHLSTVEPDSAALLSTVIPLLAPRRVSFKFSADRSLLRLRNSKRWPRGGAGKFITIYPRDEQECGLLLRELAAATVGFTGPYILSDRRFRDSGVVYYRYGGFSPTKRLTVKGEQVAVMRAQDGRPVDDVRNPFFNLPEGVLDPFVGEAGAEIHEESPTLNNGRYRVESAIGFATTGGVYVAVDTCTGDRVVIKEARPHTGQTRRGTDAVSTLRKEWRLLNRVADTGIAPRPYDFFRDWEHYYLVQELIDGIDLRNYTATDPALNLSLNRRPGSEDVEKWLHRYQWLYGRIAATLEILHDRNIVFGDLSTTNILVSPAQEVVRFIDFEGAHELGVDTPPLFFTAGFAPRELIRDGESGTPEDLYGFGALMLAGIRPIGELFGISPASLDTFLRSYSRDLGVPPAIVGCIRGLLDQSRANRLSLADAAAVLHAEHQPGVPSVGTDEADEEDLDLFLKGTLDFTLAAADFGRQDRLFPASPEVFETNPLGVAYGACGVAYALNVIRGAVPDNVLEWIARQPVTRDTYPPGLYVGLAGIAWTLLDIGFPARAKTIMALADDHPLVHQSPDLFFGASGWGMTQLRFFLASGDEAYLAKARHAAQVLSSMAKRADDQCWWEYDGTECAGLGHGTAGVCLFLLYLYKATGDTRYLDLGIAGIERLIQTAARKPEGPISWPVQASSRTVTPYLRWGSAGVGMVLLRYAHVLGDGRYDALLDGIIANTKIKFTIFPGLHIGLAGMGEFFNDLREFGRDETLATEGARTALAGLLQFKIARDSGIAFPGPTRTRISCDLGQGSAGIALFVHRFLTGAKAPFMLDELLQATALRTVTLTPGEPDHMVDFAGRR